MLSVDRPPTPQGEDSGAPDPALCALFHCLFRVCLLLKFRFTCLVLETLHILI